MGFRQIALAASGLLASAIQAPAAMVGPGDGTSPVQRERRYRVEIIAFKARNEVRRNWIGSDRVFGVFDADGARMITRRYDNVNSGEIVNLTADNRCVSPAIDAGPFDHAWQCNPDGIIAPVDVVVALYAYQGPGPASHSCARRHASDVLRSGMNDCGVKAARLIGRVRIAFGKDQLEREINYEGLAINGDRVVSGGCDHLLPGASCSGSTSIRPYYHISYRITRVQDGYSGIATGGSPPVP